MSLPIEDVKAEPVSQATPTQGSVSVTQKTHYGLTIELGTIEQGILASGQDLTTNVQTEDGYLTVTIRQKS